MIVRVEHPEDSVSVPLRGRGFRNIAKKEYYTGEEHRFRPLTGKRVSKLIGLKVGELKRSVTFPSPCGEEGFETAFYLLTA